MINMQYRYLHYSNVILHWWQNQLENNLKQEIYIDLRKELNIFFMKHVVIINDKTNWNMIITYLHVIVVH